MESGKKYYFVKLIPPRPTFSETMTDEERNIMQEHIIYWQDLMAKEICLVYGPVFDPKGAYGVGIIGVDNEAIVRDIQKNDPSVKGGLNKCEIYPMKAITK
jgi:uncharacterized protein